MGFPTTMFTVLFGLARTVGMVSTLERNDGRSKNEELEDQDNFILVQVQENLKS